MLLAPRERTRLCWGHAARRCAGRPSVCLSTAGELATRSRSGRQPDAGVNPDARSGTIDEAKGTGRDVASWQSKRAAGATRNAGTQPGRVRPAVPRVRRVFHSPSRRQEEESCLALALSRNFQVRRSGIGLGKAFPRERSADRSPNGGRGSGFSLFLVPWFFL